MVIGRRRLEGLDGAGRAAAQCALRPSGARAISTVFLSYASEQADAATRIELSLKEEGHHVFRDRSSLAPGDGYDARIRDAIADSDLFVFLVSRGSVTPGRYTLTELKFAEEKWPSPSGRVLPVQVEPVASADVPAYLRAVTVLKPQGNLTAEVAAAVAFLSAPWWRRMLAPKRLVPALVAAVLFAGIAWVGVPAYFERSAINAQASDLIKRSRGESDYGAAWKLLQEAHSVAPLSREVLVAQEDLAMDWLRQAIFSTVDVDYVDALVERTQPVLAHGVDDAKGTRRADLLAHLGWAAFLVDHAGRPGKPRSPEYYRRALEADPGDVYARAFQGYELLWRLGDPGVFPEARKQFAAAAGSARDAPAVHDYVRLLQIFGLIGDARNLAGAESEWVREAIRVVNEMRTGGEPLPAGNGGVWLRRKLWSVYRDGIATDYARERRGALLAALPPAEHLSLFRWLFPENDVPNNVDRTSWQYDYCYMLAVVQEYGGDRAGAIDSYRKVAAMFAANKYDGRNAVAAAADANAAIKRLSR